MKINSEEAKRLVQIGIQRGWIRLPGDKPASEPVTPDRPRDDAYTKLVWAKLQDIRSSYSVPVETLSEEMLTRLMAIGVVRTVRDIVTGKMEACITALGQTITPDRLADELHAVMEHERKSRT